MPIDLKLYPVNWKRISFLIRYRRAGGRCEWCGAEHGRAHPVTGSRVILTTAHLGEPFAIGASKHDKTDTRSEALACLCPRCHLNYDRTDHIRRRRENRELKRQETQAAPLRAFLENRAEK
jgi:hypothetical protein